MDAASEAGVAVLAGAVAQVVFDNAIQALPQDVELRAQFLRILWQYRCASPEGRTWQRQQTKKLVDGGGSLVPKP